MKIAIGADPGGVVLKESIKNYLIEKGCDVVDAGMESADAEKKPYTEIAPVVASMVSKGEVERAILCCGTGAGMALISNKFKGVYAVCCESVYAAKKCRAINNANVMTMGGWIVGTNMAVEMTEAFLETSLGDGLEDFRKKNVTIFTQKVKDMEEELFK